jgi:hypothetical protein
MQVARNLVRKLAGEVRPRAVCLYRALCFRPGHLRYLSPVDVCARDRRGCLHRFVGVALPSVDVQGGYLRPWRIELHGDDRPVQKV